MFSCFVITDAPSRVPVVASPQSANDSETDMRSNTRFSARWILLALGALAVSGGGLNAQEARDGYHVRAVRTEVAPILDGILEEHV